MAKLFVAILLACILACTLADDGCGSNASLNDCGASCQPTCETPKPNTKLCSRLQCTEATRGCRCDDGFYAKDGSCVPLDQC
ncbi:chymotrypsin inhibitor-like [Aphidius gifuensis]|uniref:chymotrypsin inhibitor-like n=1 Tax=Aphidius gifuensis TaxID=684658 RepID=UPI001CDD6F65|nr:chymotrypsin inhibitor-like [Aphidius gifuensis]